MENRAPTEAYEVRCPTCNCSFAPGTRHCIHCGSRIGGRLRIAGGDLHTGDVDDEVEIGTPSFLRAALWVFSILLAVLMSALRVCSE